MSDQLLHLSNAVREAMALAEMRIQGPVGAQFLWERVLTPGERKRLGNNFEKAYLQCRGTVGIWLYVRGGTIQGAVVKAAHTLGFLTDADYQWLLTELDEPVAPSLLIQWDRDRGELTLNGKLIRKVRTAIATHLVEILNAFQDSGWAEHIDDPLSDKPDGQLLRESLRTLNRGLKRMLFFADGTGHGIRWRLK